MNKINHVKDLSIWKSIPQAGPGEKAMVTFSGGIDSTVLMYHLKHRGYDVVPISYHDRSMSQAFRTVMDDIITGIGLAKSHIWADIFNTQFLCMNDEMGYIPGYKMIMQVTAMAYAESLGISKVYMGYNDENGTYFDEHEDAIQNMADSYNYVYGRAKNIQIVNPYRNFDRASIIKLGSLLDVPFELTSTCGDIQAPPPMHCGCCKRCHYRWEGFKAAGVPDYTNYLNCERWQESSMDHVFDVSRDASIVIGQEARSPKMIMKQRGTWFEGYAETGVIADRK